MRMRLPRFSRPFGQCSQEMSVTSEMLVFGSTTDLHGFSIITNYHNAGSGKSRISISSELFRFKYKYDVKLILQIA